MTLPRKIKERIRLGPSAIVKRFIPYPGPVKDGTLRCIGCGQIDENGWHNRQLCQSITSATAIYEDERVYIPIDDEARNGERQLVKRGPQYAAGQWAGDFWSYPYGSRSDEGNCPVQIDFEPTHYWPAPALEHLP